MQRTVEWVLPVLQHTKGNSSLWALMKIRKRGSYLMISSQYMKVWLLFNKLWRTASFEPSFSMKTSRWRLCSVKRVTLCACLVLVRWAALRYEYAVPDDATSASVRAVVQPEHSKTSPSVFQSRMLTLHGEHPPLQISHRRSIPVHLMLCASWAFSAHQLGCDLSFSWPSPI